MSQDDARHAVLRNTLLAKAHHSKESLDVAAVLQQFLQPGRSSDDMRASCLLLVVQSSVAGSYSAGSALLRRAPIAAAAATLRSSARCSRTAAPRLAVFDAPVGAGDDRAARERALVEWLESNGVVLSADAGWGRAAHPLRVEAETVEDFELSGRGLLARKEVVQGQEIVKVPDSLILTRETAQRVLGPSIIADDLNEYLALALLLMHERSLGARSFWAPYVNILPTAEDVGQTWLWEEEDLAQLEGSGILDATDSLRAKIEREHAALLTDVITPNALDEDAFSFEAFQWAMSMLLSRAIDLRETQQLALVPYADLLNHSPYCSSYFFFNQISFSQQREVVLYADRAYAKNDQVLISYGQKSNAELLLLYGFVVDRNLFDEVEVTVSLDESDPRYDEKVTFAHRARRTTRSAHHARRSAMPPSLRGPHPGSPPRARALFLLVISPWAPDAASPDVPLLSGGLPEAPEPRAFDGLPTAHRPLLLRAAAGEFRRPCAPAPRRPLPRLGAPAGGDRDGALRSRDRHHAIPAASYPSSAHLTHISPPNPPPIAPPRAVPAPVLSHTLRRPARQLQVQRAHLRLQRGGGAACSQGGLPAYARPLPADRGRGRRAHGEWAHVRGALAQSANGCQAATQREAHPAAHHPHVRHCSR